MEALGGLELEGPGERHLDIHFGRCIGWRRSAACFALSQMSQPVGWVHIPGVNRASRMKSDEETFSDLYERYLSRVRAYCRRRVPGEAVDDLVADVFAVVWRKIDETPEEPKTLPWLYRIAYLTTSNTWRKGSRRRLLATRLEIEPTPSADSLEDQIIVRHEVRTALSCLDELRPSDRELIRLSGWEGLDHQQLSAVLDLKPEVLRQRLHRAKKRLASLYEEKTASAERR